MPNLLTFLARIIKWLFFASIALSLRILSHLVIFELKTRDQYFEEKVKEKLCGSNFMLARVIVSFDDLLSHLKIPCVTQFLIFFL